ncbi:MAG: GGDEF domain-containing protein [Parasphingorhabdus sp.]
MKIDIKNILESYLREKRGEVACPVCTDQEGEYSPLAEIRNFLALHNLSLNAKNLEITWEYLCGDNNELKAELDKAISASEINNESVIDLHEKHFNVDIGAQIERIFLQAVEQIRNTTQLLSTGSKNAVRHENQLIEQAKNIRGGKDSLENAIQKMLNLSRLMVESTRENQIQITHTNEKLAELQKDLEVARSEADHDKLTRLPNRRKFDRDFDIVFQRMQDEQRPFVLAFVDVDHFKRINDTFGHNCGDRVLRMIADQLFLLSNNRCNISRYGGEEFAVLFEDAEMDCAFERIEACRLELSKKSLVDIGSGEPIGRVTFSAGMAQCLPSDTKQTLLRKADGALYNAKSEGRNMVSKYSNGFENRRASDR